MEDVTYRDYFIDFCHGSGFPVTSANLNALANVSVFEGPNDPGAPPARYNPLNCELQYGTSTAWNSVGVQDYKTFEQGIAASVQFFKGEHWTSMAEKMRIGTDQAAIIAAWQAGYTWAKLPEYSQEQWTARLNRIIGEINSTIESGGTTDMALTPEDIAAVWAYQIKDDKGIPHSASFYLWSSSRNSQSIIARIAAYFKKGS